MKWTRRTFLRASLLGGGSLVAGATITAALAGIARGPRRIAAGHGPLVPDPDGILDLPEGFRYRLLSPGILDTERKGNESFVSQLANGEPTPGMHDGMAAFAGPGGLTVLVRNHELTLGNTPVVDVKRARPYDPLTGGGTTTLWVDPERNLVSAFPSLSGTLRNCAGGRTPWNSWLTAEEATQTPGPKDPMSPDCDPGVSLPHGYIFEVDAMARELVAPVPLR